MPMVSFSIDRKSPVSPSEQLEAYFRDQIINQKYQPGDKLPTTTDIIGKAKVSPQTVRRAFNRLEEAGLIESTPGRGTFVTLQRSPQQRLAFRNNKASKIQNISVAGGFDPVEKGGWYRRLIIGGIARQCHELGLNFNVLPDGVTQSASGNITRYLKDMQCDGLVWVIPQPNDWGKIESLIKKNISVVVVRLAHGSDGVCSVEIDHQAVGIASVKYFQENGCEKILVMNYDRDIKPEIMFKHGSYPADIVAGMYTALNYSDSPNKEIKECKLGQYQASSDVIHQIVQNHGVDHGLFFVDAMQLLNYLYSHGQDAIEQLRNRYVVVVTNRDNYNMFLPYINELNLQTYMEQSEKLGVLAIQKLIGQINGNLNNTSTQLKPEIVLEEFSPVKLGKEAIEGIDFHKIPMGTVV